MNEHDERRAEALRRLNEKRDFRTHLAVYVIVNAMLVAIWAITGAGFFWPVFPILGWGIGLAIHAYTVFFVRPFTEDDIRREMDRL